MSSSVSYSLVNTSPVSASGGQTREGGGHTNINGTPARSVPLVKLSGGNSPDPNIKRTEIRQGGRGRCWRKYFLIIGEDYISVAAWWGGGGGIMLNISGQSLTSYCNLTWINL